MKSTTYEPTTYGMLQAIADELMLIRSALETIADASEHKAGATYQGVKDGTATALGLVHSEQILDAIADGTKEALGLDGMPPPSDPDRHTA
jgi:hypothetical protein